jgi:hypothetical protein
MSEPAKDEAELMERVVVTTCECHPGECYVKMGEMLCCAEDDKVEAVFAAIRAAGWAVVPVEPTDEMLDIGTSHIFQPGATWHKCAGDAYRAMIAAAPGGEP